MSDNLKWSQCNGACHAFGGSFPEIISLPCAYLMARCLIPRFDGAILYQEWKEALWARFAMEAP
jgi:hypothetical protein